MAPSIIKSENDSREYLGFTLDNNLRVICISDPTTDKSAAALDVAVGHFSDPAELPGLAHFCEHMLFLGTEKYPDESSYREYLSQHSGSANAFTSMEHTCYFFDVSYNHFEGALDRFSQFFISPLFTESATDREMQAVHNENGKNLQADNWRLFQLKKSLANPEHPFIKFGTGNLSTLQKDGIDTREALLKFHQQYYSANIMTLCLVGRESCEDLKKWAVEKFSDIRNKSIEVPSWKAPIYGKEQLGKVIRFVPVKNERSFEIVWPIPAQTPKYLTKPSQFISHLLGHEGPGSLLSLLKAKGWAEQLCAGSMRRGSNFALFECEVTLTEEGLKHTDEIGADIYRYLDMLRSNDYQGVQEWMHTETAAISDSNFRFKDTERPRAYAPHVAQAMQKYPAEHTLGGGALHYQYNRQDIIDVLQLLTVDNSLVFIGAPNFGGQLDRKEQWYQTEHSVTPFTSEQTRIWSSPNTDSRLSLPEQNPFIATDFTVHPIPDSAPSHPLLIRRDDKVWLWFKQDNVFRKPKAAVKFKLESPVVYSSPLTTVKSLLFTRLVEDALNEYSYYAELASLRYSISHSRTGIRFNIRGYNEKLHVLALKALQQLVNFKVDPQRFELIKAEIIREYENMKLNQPYQHCIYDQRCAIEAVRWTIPEYLAVVHAITCQDIQDFVPVILETYRAECFIHGNFTKAKALEFMDLAEGVLKGRVPKIYERPVPQRIVNLLPRHEYILARPVPNPDNKNCAVQVYWQIGPETFREIVLMDVLRQIAKTAAFEQLRTKEQLGYLVWAQAGTDNSVQSFNVIVQSSEHDASYLDQRIELWAESFAQELEELAEDKFAAYVQAVVDAKREKDKTMLEETRRWWNEIVENHYIFDRVEIECAELAKLTKADLVNFYKEYIPAAAPKRSRLSVHYYGCNHTIPASVLSTPTAQGEAGKDITVVPVTDLYEFQDTLPMYPAKVFNTPISQLTDLE